MLSVDLKKKKYIQEWAGEILENNWQSKETTARDMIYRYLQQPLAGKLTGAVVANTDERKIVSSERKKGVSFKESKKDSGPRKEGGDLLDGAPGAGKKATYLVELPRKAKGEGVSDTYIVQIRRYNLGTSRESGVPALKRSLKAKIEVALEKNMGSQHQEKRQLSLKKKTRKGRRDLGEFSV